MTSDRNEKISGNYKIRNKYRYLRVSLLFIFSIFFIFILLCLIFLLRSIISFFYSHPLSSFSSFPSFPSFFIYFSSFLLALTSLLSLSDNLSDLLCINDVLEELDLGDNMMGKYMWCTCVYVSNTSESYLS